MRIEKKYTNITITPQEEEHLIKRISSLKHLLKRFEANSESIVFVELARLTKHQQGDVFYAEVNLDLHNKILRAEHYDPDIKTAIDSVKNKLKKEIINYKDKIISKQKHGRTRV